MIKIDFHGSTHGHFLEYVTNVWIMQTAPSKTSIFKPPTYSAHAPDINYTSNRLIRCGHFSDPRFGLAIEPDDTLIRIHFDSSNDREFFIAVSNLIHKAGDVGFAKQMSMIPEHVRNSAAAVRNNWYSKFNERNTFGDFYNEFQIVDNPVFEFDFEAFFSFTEFCRALSSLSQFLNQTFFPDQALYDLWSTFITVNQGYQSFRRCDALLNSVFANESTVVDLTPIEQGWINYNLSQICRMHDGPLFDQDRYPEDSQEIHSIVQAHLAGLR